MTAAHITPAIMIGGSGSRLWPLSRTDRPKQFLNLGGEGTMFQNTLARFDADGFGPAWLLANSETLPHVFSQLTPSSPDLGGVVVEPAMRGTAAAIAAISMVLAAENPDALLLVAPADHFIRDDWAFRAAVRRAAPIADAGAIVTFGIEPTAPETGFGYIAGGAAIEADGAVVGYRIGASGFREKPDLETAKRFVAEGYLWNAGIFLFRPSVMLAEMASYAPETLAAVSAACWHATTATRFGTRLVEPEPHAFLLAPEELSIDVAVMEHTDKAVVVPCRGIGWNDVGSLSALWEIADKDSDGNAVIGDALLHQASNVFVHSTTGRRTVAAHLSDIVIVDTEDALIVLPTSEAQAVKSIVKQLKAEQSALTRYARDAALPWGSVHLDHAGSHHTAFSVNLSADRQIEARRVDVPFETWMVTSGTVSLRRGDSRSLVAPGQSVLLSRGESIGLAATGGPATLALLTAAGVGITGLFSGCAPADAGTTREVA